MKGIKRIVGWAKQYTFLFVFIVLISVLLQWLYSYLPLHVNYALAVIEPEGEYSKDVNLPSFIISWFESQNEVLKIVLIVGISMILLQAVRSVLRFLCNYSQKKLAELIRYKLKVKLYDHIEDLPFSFHQNHDVGDLIQRSTSDVDQVSDFVANQIIAFINVFATVFIGAIQVAMINVELMWVSIAVVPITAISSIIYFRYCNKQFSKIDKAESKMTTAIQENVNAARVVRAFSNEKYEFDKMDVLANSYRDENVKFNNVMAIYWALQDVMVFVQFAVTMAVSISLAKKGLVTVAEVSAVILLLNMLVFPMRGLGRIISSFGKASVAANRIGEVLDTETEYKINGNLTPQIKGNIEFNNVSFKFKDDDRHLLNGISFKIKAGQTIALVGKTGSGKSTICNLLARFLEIDSGSIIIDGVDIRDIDKKHLRSNIRYVVQDPFLFSKTLYENIAISKKNITENEVISAAKTAAIHDDVLKFKQGYETIVGEKGTTLSGGQKQRVAIARMLVDESPVIIFDDSLSALDTKTDVLIRKALKLKSSEQTMIIITHRITTAKEADLILVLDDGIIKEMGTHDELVKNDGLYSKLWGIQGELENEYMNVLKDGE